LVETLLTLLFGTFAVAIKVRIVQCLTIGQPSSSAPPADATTR